MTSTSDQPLVAYVDDEQINLTVFEASYASKFNVAVFNSSEKAVEALQGKSVGIILTDQRMPVETGVNLLTRMKDLHPDAIRVLVTAYTDQEPMIQAINRAQIDRFIPKPWDHREMEELLHGAIDTYLLRLRVKQLELSLIAAQRTDVLGKLAAGLVHDMASPLSSIAFNVERLRASLPLFKWIQKEHQLTREDAETLSEMPALTNGLDQSSNYLIQLITGIREHWRPPSQDATSDVKAVTEFVKRMLVARARQATVTLTFDVTDVPSVKMAPSNMCQVVINLLTNAVQAFTDDIQRREVCLTVRAEGDGAIFTVVDTGKGVDPSILSRLGKEQVTTKAAGEGMGVGLLSSRVLVLRAGGRFVMSSSAEGTKVEFWLPFAPKHQ